MAGLGLTADAAEADLQAARRVHEHEAGDRLDSNELLRLKLAHPRIWPAVRDTRNEVYLARGIRGEERRPGTMCIENYDFAIERNLQQAGKVICRSPSQNQNEFDALRRDLDLFKDGGARYLRRAKDRQRLPELIHADAGEVLEDLMIASDVPQRLPTFLPWPGLSQNDLDSMLKELRTFYEKLPVKKTGYSYV
jgi:hypothetical protein